MRDGTLTIRDLDRTDVDAVLQISEQLNLSRWSRSDIDSELESKDSLMLVATLADEPIGFIIGRRIPGSREGEIDGEIYNIGVLPKYHRTGIGGSLLRGFIATLRDQKIINVWLEVRAGNLSAIGFYRRYGFIEIVTRKAYYTDPVEDAIVMCLKL
jgi:ribosomal-protein-alanine N-acetyltransferase